LRRENRAAVLWPLYFEPVAMLWMNAAYGCVIGVDMA
jgi:hypothetical protein